MADIKTYLTKMIEGIVQNKLNSISPLNNTKNTTNVGIVKVKSVDTETNKATVTLPDGSEKTGVTIATSRPTGPGTTAILNDNVMIS